MFCNDHNNFSQQELEEFAIFAIVRKLLYTICNFIATVYHYVLETVELFRNIIMVVCLFALYAIPFIAWRRNPTWEHCARFSPFRAHKSLRILLSSIFSNQEDHGHSIWYIPLFIIAKMTSKCFIDCFFLCFSFVMFFSPLCIDGFHVHY